MNQKMFYHKVCLCIPVGDFRCLLFIWFLCLCSFIEESLSLYRPCLSLGALEAEICKQANKSSKRSMEGGKNLYILSVTVTWFLPKEQIDQTKGRFTESFRERLGIGIIIFQVSKQLATVNNIRSWKVKTEEFLCIVSDQSTCYANDSHI